MRNLAVLLTILASLTLAGCASNPVSGRQDFVMMTEAQEIALGRASDAEVRKQYKVYDNPALQAYVDHIGQELAARSHRPGLHYHFTVLDTPEINAFALPGGYVYITRGILAYLNSEAEMAAVLGHEIGHVTARHGVRQQSAAQAANLGISIASIFLPELNTQLGHDLTNLFGGALLSGYGREHELEADRLGAEYLARAHYDPQAMIHVIDVLKNQELFDAEVAKQEGREPSHYHGTFATHPDNDTRLQQVVGEAEHLVVEHPIENRSEFLRETNGLAFNESVEEGVVRDGKFMHRDLGIALTFPVGWSIKNTPSQLVALSPGNDAAIQLRIDPKPSGTVAEYVHRALGSSNPVEAFEIENLHAAIGSASNVELGVVYYDRKAFLIVGKAKSPAALDAQRGPMKDTIRSFHILSEEERRQIRPLTLRLVTARPGDTYARLAQHSPLGKNAESYLRLINAQYPQGEPAPGQTIKTIE